MISLEYVKKEIENTQVTLLVGGKAKRMNGEIKCLMRINNMPLIERTLKQYTDYGFKNFNILAGYGHNEVEDYLKNESQYAKKIHLNFSIDDPVWKSGGKGKALKLALLNKTIDDCKRSIITYPDDIFTNNKLPKDLIKYHIHKIKEGYSITVVTTPGTEYPFGEVEVNPNGSVKRFVEKPFVSKITNTGLCVIEPDVYLKINELINLTSNASQEFEKEVLEKIAGEGKIVHYSIDYDSWIAINTIKEFDMAKKRLEKN